MFRKPVADGIPNGFGHYHIQVESQCLAITPIILEPLRDAFRDAADQGQVFGTTRNAQVERESVLGHGDAYGFTTTSPT
jgi:hypothetical protein